MKPIESSRNTDTESEHPNLSAALADFALARRSGPNLARVFTSTGTFVIMALLLVMSLLGNCLSACPAHAQASSSWRPCPNRCLKLSSSGWDNRIMEGKPTYLIWMNFPYKDGSGAGECWSLDHLGELIEYVDQRPVDRGACPTCGGRLYLGDPTKGLKQRAPIPLHPGTYKKDNQTVLGRPWAKLSVNASVSQVYNWYSKQFPGAGWAIVDHNQVSGAYFVVITDGARSKWVKFAPTNQGTCEVIMMARNY